MTTEIKARVLTPKQERFALFLFQGLSQRDAYVKAGYSPTQSPDALDSHACVLANDERILARLAEFQAKAKSAAIADEVERKETLTRILRCTPADFADEDGNLAIKSREQLRNPAIQELKTTATLKSVEKSLKLRDPIAAIAELNKMERIGAQDTQPVSQDNRVLIINVNSDNAKSLIDRLAGRLNATE